MSLGFESSMQSSDFDVSENIKVRIFPKGLDPPCVPANWLFGIWILRQGPDPLYTIFRDKPLGSG